MPMSETLETGVAVAVPAALVVGGIMLAASLVRRLVASLDYESQEAFNDAARALPRVSSESLLQPSVASRDARRNARAALDRVRQASLSPAAAARVAALIEISAAPYAVENPESFTQSLRGLATVLPSEAGRTGRTLMETLRAGHGRVFVNGLARACTSAMEGIGFTTVETAASSFAEIRVIGTDARGCGLVAEIQVGDKGDPTLAAEVVGVHDGTCADIMEKFEQALAAQGVRYAPARRKPTGGIRQLRAAQEFVCRQVTRTSSAPAPAVADAQAGRGRTARLNRDRQRVRQ
jgi:hypothetical protein